MSLQYPRWVATVEWMALEDPFQELSTCHASLVEAIKGLAGSMDILRHTRPDLRPQQIEWLRNLNGLIRQRVLPHIEVEDRIVLNYIESHIPRLAGAVAVLHMEHDDIALRQLELGRVIERFSQSRTETVPPFSSAIEELGIYLVFLLKNHLRQEGEIIYRQASEILSRDEKRDLMVQIEKQRKMGRVLSKCD